MLRTSPRPLLAAAVAALATGSLLLSASPARAQQPPAPQQAPVPQQQPFLQPTLTPVPCPAGVPSPCFTMAPSPYLTLTPPPYFTMAPLPAAPTHRNNAMRIAGIVISALAASLTVVGAVVLPLGIQSENTNRDDEGAVAGLGLIVLSTGIAMSALGVPLWIAGSLPPKAETTGAMRAVPQVIPGPGTVMLRWTF